MRISEDRYSHELKSIDTALRLIRCGARTKTICEFTGLSADRVRALYRTYVRSAPHHLSRPRGRSPYQVTCFMSTPRHQEQTIVLARMLSLLGAVPPAPGLMRTLLLPDLERANLVCFGFEMYLAQVTEPLLTIEHAIFLTKQLIKADYLLLDNCVECTGLVLSEYYAKGLKRCASCGGLR